MTSLAGTPIHPILLYAALFSPAVVVTLVYVVARPDGVFGIALAGLLALAIIVFGLPKVACMRSRENADLESTANSLAPAFAAGAAVHPVRYGLGEPTGVGSAAAISRWDQGPSRTGALTVEAGTLRLRGTDGTALDVPLAEVQGAVLLPSGVAWLAPSVDVLLGSGDAIEVRSSKARAIVDALAGAGVQVVAS